MELLHARQARSDLLMSHTARMQVGQAAGARPQNEALRPANKNHVQATTTLLLIGIYVMYKSPRRKVRYPGIIRSVP